MLLAAGSPSDINAPVASSIATAYAQAASQGTAGVNASATAIASAISAGGSAASATALSIANALGTGSGNANAIATALAQAVANKGCSFVQPTLAKVFPLF